MQNGLNKLLFEAKNLHEHQIKEQQKSKPIEKQRPKSAFLINKQIASNINKERFLEQFSQRKTQLNKKSLVDIMVKTGDLV